MMSTNRLLSRGRLPVIAAIAVLLSGCAVQEQSFPGSSGPSELGLSLSVTAAPEILPRDGSSMARITVKAFDAQGKPAVKQRLLLLASAGTLSVDQVETAADGTASVTFVAPGLNENVSSVTITVAPIRGSDVANTNTRSVQIAVLGPSFPAPSFTVTPTITDPDSSPPVSEAITFDASATTLGGVACGGACSYSWDFGDGSSSVSGQAVQHKFDSANVFTVKLTVTAPGGTSSSVTKSVVIAAPDPPTAAFTVTPDPANVNVQAIFNGATSKVGAGATLVQYVWDFGDGTSATTTVPVAPKTYTTLGAKGVTLTVTDSLGRTSTATRTVNVVP